MGEKSAIRNPQSAILRDLRVMKFGGTSVGDAERIRATAAIVAEHTRQQPTVTVVSAMAKVTDQLLKTAHAAAAGDVVAVQENLAAIGARHAEAARELLDGERLESFEAATFPIFAEVENTCDGIRHLGYCPARALDIVLGAGERLSALLLAATLSQSGTPAQACDATRLVITDANFGEAEPQIEPTTARLREAVPGLLAQGIAPIIAGFIGGTADGTPTTLGRGGSDYSATLVAACLNAADVIIWTDVEGIFSADPNLVPNARVLPAVTYQEAAELSYYGAKVLHPKTLAPLAERGIPVWTKSSFRPEAPGTVIAPRGTHGLDGGGSGARAVTALKKAVLITVESTGQLSAMRIMSRAFSALDHEGIDLLMLSQASCEESFCFAVQAGDAERVLRRLQESFAVELAHGYIRPLSLQDGVAILALIGSGMRGAVGIAGKLFGALWAARVNVIAIAQGATETNISVAVEEAALANAVRAVHRALLEGAKATGGE